MGDPQPIPTETELRPDDIGLVPLEGCLTVEEAALRIGIRERRLRGLPGSQPEVVQFSRLTTDGTLRIQPIDVLKVASMYDRPIDNPAYWVIKRASQVGPEAKKAAEDQVEDFLYERGQTLSREEFLAEARHALPGELYSQVKESYEPYGRGSGGGGGGG